MKKLILSMTLAALLATAGAALAQGQGAHAGHGQAAQPAAAGDAAPAKSPAGHGGHGGKGGMMPALTPEQTAAVHNIHEDFNAKAFPLRQDMATKKAELNAVMLQANPDAAKAKALNKEINDLETKIGDLSIDARLKIAKETGIRGGHVPGMEGMMGGGMGGMMGGKGCPMMSGGH